jgi:mycothiol system anti-sigma-R factor
MSCGEPHDLDCVEVLGQMYLYLDAETSRGTLGTMEIKHHLAECAPCLRKYGLEEQVKALVARCCGNDQAPARLRDQVLLHIAQIRREITEQQVAET